MTSPKSGPDFFISYTQADREWAEWIPTRMYSPRLAASQKRLPAVGFNIPRSNIPKDGSLTVFASRPAAWERGSSRLQLGTDANPAMALRLEREISAQLRGIVVDSQNRAIAGARVSVIGFEAEAIPTNPSGGFVLPAHAGEGQQIQLHVQKQATVR